MDANSDQAAFSQVEEFLKQFTTEAKRRSVPTASRRDGIDRQEDWRGQMGENRRVIEKEPAEGTVSLLALRAGR